MKQDFFIRNQAEVIRKVTASFITILFILNQTAVTALALPVQQETTALPAQALKDVNGAVQEEEPVSDEIETVETVEQFLSNDLTLEELPASTVQEESEASNGEEADDREADAPAVAAEAESFEAAVSHLAETENAAISIIRNLSLENLSSLANLGYEIGLAVVDGLIVAFTSHDETQIRVAEVLKTLLDSVSTTFLAHFQPVESKPSYVDQVGAADRGGRTEYAVNKDLQVSAYTGDSVEETTYSVVDLYTELQRWVGENPSAEKLNKWAGYFSEIETLQELILYRSAPPDIFPNKPVLQFFNGGGAPFMSQWNAQPASASLFKLDYDVTAGFQGAVMNFLGGQGAANLTTAAFSTISFNLRHNVSCGAADDCMKIEFQDTDNDLVSVTLKELGFNPSASFSQLNISRAFLQGKNGAVNFGSIKQINFVVGNAETEPDTGFFEIETGSLAFNPVAPTTSDAVTTFASIRPTVGEVEPCSTPGQNPCVSGTLDTVTALTVDAHNHYTFSYNLGNGTDAAGRFAAALMNFNGQLFNTNSSAIVLGLKGTGTTGGKLKIEVIDNNGDKVVVKVDTLSTSFQKFKITKALLESAEIPGFDATQIASIVLVVDPGTTGSNSAIGAIEVNTDGLAFTPTAEETVNAVTDFSAKQPTVNELEPCATAGQNPCTSGTLNTITDLTQDSPDHYSFSFNLDNGSDTGFRRFGGTLINFGTNTVNSTSGIVLGLKGTGTTGGKLKLEVIDNNGDKVTVNVTGITGSFKNFRITKALLDLAGIPNFDGTQISQIVLVVDDTTTGSNSAIGTFEVNTDGLFFSPVAVTTANPVTNFSALRPTPGALEPCATAGQDPCTSGTLNTVTNFAQDSHAHFAFDFDLGNGSDTGNRRFSGGIIDFGALRFNTTGNPIVLGLKGTGTTGSNLKIEVIDTNNRKVVVRVNGLTGSFQNYEITKALLESAGIPSYDATQIRLINIIVDNTTTGDSGAEGTIEVNTSGLNFPVVAEETADAVSNFSTQQPTAGPLEPCAVAGQNPCTSGTLNTIPVFNQDSSTHFSFDFDLGNGSDSGFRRFGGSLINFGTSFFNTTGNPIVLGLKGTGTTGGKLKLDIVDNNGDKVTVLVQGLTSSFKNFKITKALLDAAGVVNFDATQIAAIVVVVDDGTTGSKTAAGTIEVNTQGLKFNPTAEITVDPVTNFVAQRPTVGSLEPCATAGQDPCTSGTLDTITTFTQDAKNHFEFDFNLGNGSDTGFRRFGGALINFGTNFFNTTGAPIVLGLLGTGTTGGKLKLDIVDNNGDKVTVFVEGLTNAFQNFKITKALLESAGVPNFDATQIASIVVVVDDSTTGSTSAVGGVEVNTDGLYFEPVALVTTDPVRKFTSLRPSVGELEPCATAGQNPCTSGTLNTITSFNQPSTSKFIFNFDLGNGSDSGFRRFGGALMNFAPNTTGGGYVFGLKGTGTGGKMKLVFTDAEGDSVTIRIEGLTTSFKNFKVPESMLNQAGNPNFNSNQVAAVSFVVDDSTTGSTSATGTVEVNTGGLDFVPTAVETADPVKDLSFKQPSVGALEPCATAGQNPCTSGTLNTVTAFNQPAHTDFNFDFDLGNGSDSGFRRFGGALLNFGATPISGGFVFGLKGTGTTGGKLKVVFTDINGKQVTVNVTNLTGSFKNYKFTNTLLNSAGVVGFDATKIAAISFVADSTTTGSNTAVGNIAVKTKGTAFVPTAEETTDALKDLSFKRPSVGELEPCATAGQNPCTSGTLNTITDFTQTDSDNFSFGYDLNNGADSGFRRFGGALLNFASNPVSGGFVFGFKGTGATGGKLKLVFTDINNKEVTVLVTNLTDTIKKYKITNTLLQSAGVPGFNAGSIKAISLVVDEGTTGSATAAGVITVQTKGVAFDPTAVVTADPVTDFNAEKPTTGILEPCATANQNPCTSGTLNTVTNFVKDSPDHFLFDYNLGNGFDSGFRRFAGVLLNFGANLFDTNSDDIILGLKGTGTTGGKMKIDVVDNAGRKVTVKIEGLTGSFQNFKITQAMLLSAGVKNFDPSKIQVLSIVVDNNTTGSNTAVGTIEVNTNGMTFEPEAVETLDAVTDFQAKQPVPGELEPCATAGQDPCTSGTLNTVTNFNQPSRNNFKVDFNLANGSDTGNRRFGGAILNFGTDYVDSTTDIVLGLKGTGTGGKLKLEFVDASGDKVTVRVSSLSSGLKNFKITKAMLDSAENAAFDSTQIAAIVFVVDDGTTGSASASGNFEVQTKGMRFSPLAVVTADPISDFSAKRPPVGELEPCATAGQDPCTSGILNTITSFNQDATNHFALNFDLGNGSDSGFRRFGGALINFGTNTINTGSAAVVMALKSTGTSKLVLEFVDASGDKVRVRVEGLTGSYQNFKITKTLLESAGVPNFDATAVASIVVIIDDVAAGSPTATGGVDVQVAGLDFVPSAEETADAVTDLSAKSPAALALEPCATAGQDPCTSGTLNTVTNFNQDTANHFSLDYDLNNGNDTGFRRFAGALIEFGANTYDTTTPLVLGLKGTGTTSLKLDFVDVNGVKVTIKVNGLTSSFKNFKISKTLLEAAGIVGFDPTQIKTVAIVVDPTTAGSPAATGTIEVNTQGLDI